MASPVLCIVGPTASGKTQLAVAVAQRLNGVVLSADAFQVYRGFNVGTGKEGTPQSVNLPVLGDVHAWVLDGVPQLGIDLADPNKPFTVAQWQQWAQNVVETLQGEHVPVVVTGGSGLYVESLLRGFQFPATNSTLREQLVRQLPLSPGPRRRALRSAEIERLGQRPTAQPPAWPWKGVGIDPPRNELRQAIRARVTSWFESRRFLDEVDNLRSEGFSQESPAFAAIGYSEALSVLEGLSSVDEAINRIVQRTWAYTRRQRTYFRQRLPELVWVSSSQQGQAVLLKRAEAS